MDYADKQDAKARFRAALADMGWRCYGYKPDNSDSMTDYYEPARWDGVATFTRPDGRVVILVVDASPDRSGYMRCKLVYEPGPTCKRCNGGKADPSFWRLDTARANPVDFNVCHMDMQQTGLIRRVGSSAFIKHSVSHGGGMVSLAPVTEGEMAVTKSTMTVVSPLCFLENGFLCCVACGGSGASAGTSTSVPVETFPEFKPLPARTLWQVECDDVIVDAGSRMWTESAASMAIKWTRIAQCSVREPKAVRPVASASASAAPQKQHVVGKKVSVILSSNLIRLRFKAKPPRHVLNVIGKSGIGMYWAGNAGEWRVRYSDALLTKISEFAAKYNGGQSVTKPERKPVAEPVADEAVVIPIEDDWAPESDVIPE